MIDVSKSTIGIGASHATLRDHGGNILQHNLAQLRSLVQKRRGRRDTLPVGAGPADVVATRIVRECSAPIPPDRASFSITSETGQFLYIQFEEHAV